jgi:hypothetical protein
MIIRIIREGSSARSSISVMFAAKMSRVREKIGLENRAERAASGLERPTLAGWTDSGRSGTRASTSSRLCIGADFRTDLYDMSWTDGGGDRDRTQQQRPDGCNQRGHDLRLTEHLYLPFSPASFCDAVMQSCIQDACQLEKSAEKIDLRFQSG